LKSEPNKFSRTDKDTNARGELGKAEKNGF
jgi:hypothetical protein